MRRATEHLLRFATVFGAAIVLAGCTSSSDRYPSLAIRDVERVEGSFTPTPAPPPALPSAATLASLDDLRAQAVAAHADFTNATPRARNMVAAAQGTSVGSRRWEDAQIALADLESLRSLTAIPLGDVDTLYVAASVDGTALDRIGQARADIVTLVADEDTVLAALRGQLGS